MQLSVIVVSYNVKYFLEQCLYSVEAASKNIEAEILVIDNASTDNSIEYLQPKFPAIIFIRNAFNEGFSKANNKALQFATGEYILYLNPDTIVAEKTFLNCIHFLREHAEAGAIGVRMIDGGGNFLPESKRSFPSISASFFKMSGLASLFPRSAFFNRYALGNLDENKIHEADVLSGAFLMARKNILLQINGFDEDFFMYGEDIDLSYRVKQSGYKNYYLGDNSILHFKGESTQTDKTVYLKNFYEAMKIFVHKHYKKRSVLFLKTSIAASRAAASLKRSFPSGNKKEITNYFLLAGDFKDVVFAEKILSDNKKKFRQTNELAQLNELSFSGTKQAIVFCTGELSYAETINFMQKNKNKYAYFWHRTKSDSITGSRYSNAAGEIYVSH